MRRIVHHHAFHQLVLVKFAGRIYETVKNVAVFREINGKIQRK